MNNQTNIPNLRFPEFKGEWEMKKLGEVAEFKAGYAFKSEQMLSERSNFQLLKMSNVYKNELRLDRNASYWEKLSSKEKEFLLKDGDTILTLTGTVGKQDYGYSVQIKENNKYLLNQRLVLLREVKNKSNNDFIFQIISNEIFLFYFFAEAKGGTGNQTNVGTDDVKNIQLNFPPLPEQTKIATFLTAVDEKLQALKKKHSLLEQYKKGVMQKLFSQELRFKDENGEDFAEWEVKKLGEVLIKNSIKNKGQKYSLVQSVSNKYGFINQDEMFEDRRVASKDTSNYYVIEKGHFTYNPSRIDVGSLAYKFDDEISIISPLYISFRGKQEFLKDDFLLSWFTTEQFQMQMNNSFEGSVRNTLSYDSLIKMEILIPSLPEQAVIANFLSAIDAKINHTKLQIEQTALWKKGLLQKMFC